MNAVNSIARRYMCSIPKEVIFLGGVPNCTYLVNSDTEQIVIRVCNNGYTSDSHLIGEIQILDYLDKQGFSYSPRILRSREGLDIEKWQKYRVIAMDFKPGQTADKASIDIEFYSQLGRSLGQLQRLLKNYGSFGVLDSDSYPTRVNKLIEKIDEYTLQRDWGMSKERLFEDFKLSSNILKTDEGVPDQLIHSDIWPPNVIVNQGKLCSIIDFDDWSFGNPNIEIAAAILEFSVNKNLEFDKRAFVDILEGFYSVNYNRKIEVQILIHAMISCCIGWFACNLLHDADRENTLEYVGKKNLLETSTFQRAMEDILTEMDSKFFEQPN